MGTGKLMGWSKMFKAKRFRLLTVVAAFVASVAIAPAAYAVVPVFTSMTPALGSTAGGTAVTITGSGFTGATGVTFAGAAATGLTVTNDTTISATTPVGAAGTVSVVVTTPGGSNVANTAFTYVAPAVLTSVTPSSGPASGGTVVVIAGSGFTGATSVTFAGVAGTALTVNSATQITVTTPAGAAGAAGAVSVLITNGGVANAANTAYTYVAAPAPVAAVVAPPIPPTPTVSAPVTRAASSTAQTQVRASIGMNGSNSVSVTVTVPAGDVTNNAVVSIAPAVTSAEAVAGLISIRVTITDATGTELTQFNTPLTVNLGVVAANTIPAFSKDGLVWTVIQKLVGVTLPDGVQQGYYQATDGSIVILTRHLTYFGVKRPRGPLLGSVFGTTVAVGDRLTMTSFGGTGTGAISF
jgi:hypothetical protein